MLPKNKIFRKNKKSEEGFVLVAALIATLIMVAVGFFALTISTQDIRISSKYIGERKAFSATESAQTDLAMNFNPKSVVPYSRTNTQVDSVNDPCTRYTTVTSVPDLDGSVVAAGMEMVVGKRLAIYYYNSTITGRDTCYNSTMRSWSIMAFGPIEPDTGF